MKKQEIIKKLKAKNIRVIKELSSDYYNESLMIIFKDKSKYKVGFMRVEYMHRYGIDVFCVFRSGCEWPWIKGQSYHDYITKEIVDCMKNDNIEKYRPLKINLDILSINH